VYRKVRLDHLLSKENLRDLLRQGFQPRLISGEEAKEAGIGQETVDFLSLLSCKGLLRRRAFSSVG